MKINAPGEAESSVVQLLDSLKFPVMLKSFNAHHFVKVTLQLFMLMHVLLSYQKLCVAEQRAVQESNEWLLPGEPSQMI